MKITLIQTNLFWEDKQKNISNFNNLIDSIKEDTDIIVLPEMFNTGFAINPLLAETIEDYSIFFLKEKAIEKNATIITSLMIKDSDMVYNRLVAVSPTTIETYDKRHLFCLSDENKLLTKGNQNTIFNIKGWKIQPQICYDLRFPKTSRNSIVNNEFNYDILINVANWPKSRSKHWKALLKARAIENQSYVIGVNRIGIDGKDIEYDGSSMVVNYSGDAIILEDQEFVKTFDLNKDALDNYRVSFPFSKDWD